MGELAARTIFSNDTGPLAGTGLDALAKNQGAILELEGAAAPQSKTIASGSISPTAAYVIVDTEGGAAADDLSVINPVLSASENLHDGMVLYLKAADSGRVVTVKNSGSANGINTYDGNDYVLSTTHWLKLQLRADGKWYEVEGRAMEAALAAITAAATAQSTANTANTIANTAKTITDTVTETPGAGKIPKAGSGSKIDSAWFDFSDSAVSGSSSNLIGSATGTNANVTYSADEVVVKNTDGKYLTLRSVSVTASTSSSGAGGLDTGTISASTWYYVHIIHNPTTSTTNLLLSLSATSPTLPSGYTFRARVGSIRTDSTANKYPLGFTQAGRLVQYRVASGSNLTALPIVVSGTQGAYSGTYVSASVSNFVPPTAKRIGLLANYSTGAWIVSPNNSYGGANNTSNPAFVPSLLSGLALPFWMGLESTNIYYAAESAAKAIFVHGWEDNL